MHVEEVKSNDPNFKMPEEPKRKQAKKNVTFEDKTTETSSSNVKSFKQKKQTSPQKDPIRTNNTNESTKEEKTANQGTNEGNARSPSKSPKLENKEHAICPPGFINVLQSRMVFDWFKELMRCREDSIGVGMLLECHSTNFQKSLYFVSKTRAPDSPTYFVFLENQMWSLWRWLLETINRYRVLIVQIHQALFLAVPQSWLDGRFQAWRWRLFSGILFLARTQAMLQRQRVSQDLVSMWLRV